MGVPFLRYKIVSLRQLDLLKFASFATLLIAPLLWQYELLIAEKTSLSALLLYLPQHFYLILPFVFALAATIQRRPRLIQLNFLTLIFCVLFPLGWQWHRPSTPSGQSIRLITFNVQRGEGAGDEAHIAMALQTMHPDIICMQETGHSSDIIHNAVGHNIAKSFPNWTVREAGDVTTLSRFPLVSQHIHPLPGTRRTLETVFQTPTGPLRVLNTHVSTAFKGDRRPTSKLDHIARLFETARPSAQARLDQLPALHAAISSGNARLPLILAGDFNTPPRGLFYSGLAHDLNDAFALTGQGLGQTFPASLPLLRIDYIWTRGVHATHTFVGEQSGADHRPLISDIEVHP